MQSVPEQQGPYGKGRPQSSPSQVRGDPTSPTRVEQGLGRNNDVPLPPSTPSSGSRRVGNEGQQSQQQQGIPGFQGPMFDWNFVGQMPGQTPNQMPGACPMPGTYPMSGAYPMSGPQQMPGACLGPNQMSGPCLDPNGSNGFQGQMPNSSAVPGGVTPQMSMYQDVLRVLPMLGPHQLAMVRQFVNEGMQSQFRGIPESFGENPLSSGFGRSPERFAQNEVMGQSLPLGNAYGESGWIPQDVFSKSEKWIGNPPVANTSSWTSRESEVLGWLNYTSELASWAMQASLEFGHEVQHACRWPEPIEWISMTQQQRARSMRLMAILKSTFSGHPRTSTLISAFSEGIVLSSSGMESNVGLQASNGFELMRQLTLEYSVKTRSEALSFRSAIANRTFTLSASETSPASVVTDTIRRLDYEAARFQKLLGTLPKNIDVTGLQLAEPDLLAIMLRSLPEAVRNFVLHHAGGDTYQSFRSAAQRWEQQQRMFQEFHTKKGISQVVDGAEWYDVSGDTEYHIDAVQGDRCGKCGSRKHSSESCQVDLAKVKCFRCQEFGHVGLNCPKNRESGKGKKGFSKGVQKGDRFDKGKSKGKSSKGSGSKGKSGKGFGKKGKLNEVSWNEEDSWWYDNEWDPHEHDWSWGVEQVGWNEGFYDNDWTWHEGSNWTEAAVWNEAKGSEEAGKHVEDEKSSSKTVGSLTLHAIFHESFCDEEFSHVGSLCLQPFGRLNDDGSCLPQPFGRLENGRERDRLEDVLLMPQLFDRGRDVLEKDRLEDVSLSPQPFVVGAVSGRQLDSSGPFEHLGFQSGSYPQLVVKPSLSFGGAVLEDVDSEGFHEGLIHTDSRRVCMFKVKSDHVCKHDTTSFEHEFVKFFPIVFPLLSELSLSADSTWWLLDSGAAVTVLSDAHFPLFGTQIDKFSDEGKFKAANGSSVKMRGLATVTLKFQMLDPDSGGVAWRSATMQVLVGQTHHNILSTTALADSGWIFSQWRTGCEVRHESNQVMTETVFHAGCPWVRMYPSTRSGSSSDRSVAWHVSQSDVVRFEEAPVQPLSPAVEAQLEMHRRQGHFPHHPACTECARGRGVFAHRRRKKDSVECELQADFCFLSRRGEIVESDDAHERNMKILVITDMLSGCIAFIVVTDRRDQVQTQVCSWLDSFGLMSHQTSIILHTDDERSVGELVGRSSKHYLFQIRRAAPQQHRSIGGAERGVRKLKEGLSVLRSDLNKQGYDVRYSFEGLRDCLTYLSLMHNHFGRAGGTNLSPLETSAGRALSKPTVSSFGSVVLAELPDSIRQYAPNETRNVEAAYVHPGLGTGAAVEGLLRVDGQLQLRRFYARNVREVSPLTWKAELCKSVLIPVERLVEHDTVEPPLLPVPDQLGGHDEDLFGEEKVEDQPVGHEYSPTPEHELEDLDLDMKDDDEDEYVPKRKSARKRVSKRPNAATHEDVEKDAKRASRDVMLTPNCPACQSGMNAPGIRHSAACKRRQKQLKEQLDSSSPASGQRGEGVGGSGPVVFQPAPEQPSDVGEAQRLEFQGQKRQSDTSLEKLEEDLKAEVEDMEVETLSSLGFLWLDNSEPVVIPDENEFDYRSPATSPLMFDECLSSIKFHGNDVKSERIKLCNKEVLLWHPTEAVDDTTLIPLDPALTVEGMREEIRNMTKCCVGRVVSGHDVELAKKSSVGVRVIPARWVTAFKTSDRVRARVVAKDLRSKSSARELGFSSPTPSCEILHIVLSIASEKGWRMRSLDVSHAFMQSPLPGQVRIILKLPQSISTLTGELAYLDLLRSLNGLRDASLHWLQLLSSTITHLGLWADEYEPCCYQGHVYDGDVVLGTVILVVYVDDILMCSSSRSAEEKVVQAISAVVPTKTTGCVLPAGQGGGRLQFIGRTIERTSGCDSVFVSVGVEYLKSTFEEFQVSKGSKAVPDVASHLEKVDEASLRPLSPEAYSRFRKGLGRLLWLSQTRADVKAWLSLIGSQQSKPTQGTEAALKAVLRFLFGDGDVILELPSTSELLVELGSDGNVRPAFLQVFTDASHAPYRFNNRKGVSGQAIFFKRSLIRSVSKQQQATALSSCEAELYGLQQATQDATAMSRVVHRVLWGIGDVSEFDEPLIQVESDSSSALQLVQGLDLPRRSRHIEIRLMWLRSQVSEGHVVLKHHPGVTNIADIFTKCLGTQLFERHRLALGFRHRDFPAVDPVLSLDEEELFLVEELQVGGIALVEVCCEPESSLSVESLRRGYRYIGVVKDVQSDELLSEVRKRVREFRQAGLWVHVHVSTPCSSGSPLKNFSQDDTPTIADLEWESIIGSVGRFL